MALAKGTKIAIGWFFIVFGGLGSFGVAREIIYSNRVEMMKSRKRIKAIVEKETKEKALAKAAAAAEKE